MKITRTRRNRKSEWIRNLVSESSIDVNDLIYPIFCLEAASGKEAVEKMPDVFRLGNKEVLAEVKKAYDLGLNAVMLFPVIPDDKRSEKGEYAYSKKNKFLQLISEVKKQVPEIGIICDVALDPYTTHGHDGVLDSVGYVDNDKTVDALVKQAVSLAVAGADAIAPSDMMDGRVVAIRGALDERKKQNVNIISYSAKYASSFYGPFRQAVGSAKKIAGSDKKSYQLNPANSEEALRKVAADIEEGADSIIIKPASHYLDIIKQVKQLHNIPVFAYQVSGEYSMMKLASQNDIINYENAIFESLLCFKRAGANAIITYAAIEIAELLIKK